MNRNLSIAMAGLALAGLTACSQKSSQTTTSTTEQPLFKTRLDGRIATDGGASRGVAWGDIDGDGDPDLYVANTNGQWNALYRNNGNGRFKKMTYDGGDIKMFAETVKHGGRSEGINWVDYDNDGDLDLYVVSRGQEPNLLFRNMDNLGFIKVDDSPLTDDSISASMACWADIEGDGDLDVLVTVSGSGPNALFRNEGDGDFARIEDHVMAGGSGRGRACACGDANGDGLPEFYIANAMRPNFYFVNRGNWEIEAVQSGHLVEDVGYSYGVSWTDYDDDGDLDLFVANFNKRNVLYRNDGTGELSPAMDNLLSLEDGGASKGHSWGDYDNDGDIDLFVANGTYQPDMYNFLYRNSGDGNFTRDLTGDMMKHADTSAGAAHADFDRDGDLDLFVANWGSGDQVNAFYENQTAGRNWIAMRLKGSRSNTYGIGAKVRLSVTVDGESSQQHRWMYPVTGYGSQNDYELHFGLGSVTTIDSLSIEWPSGVRDLLVNPDINQHYTAEEAGSLLQSE